MSRSNAVEIPDDERVVPYQALFWLEEYERHSEVTIIGERVEECNAYWWIQFVTTPKQPIMLARKAYVHLRRTGADGRVRIVRSDNLMLERLPLPVRLAEVA